MTKKRDLRLERYNITSEKYRELKYFCLQYPQWKKILNSEESALKAITVSDMPISHKNSDTTTLIAVKRTEVKEKCDVIEETAKEVNPYIAPSIIKNVTEGIAFEYMNVFCGRRQFYEARKKFFYLLSKKR